MSILIDSAEGSRYLVEHFTPKGIAQLVSGLPTDVTFLINGPNGKLAVGIEHKKLPDALECIKTGRLTDVQIPKLRGSMDVCLLMIETGIMRRNSESGLIELLRGDEWRDTSECGWGAKPWLYRDFMGWLWSVQFGGGIWLLPFVKNKAESAWLITNLYNWGQELWTEHKSFKQMFISGAPTHMQIPLLFEAAGEVSLFRRVAAGLPHVGWEISEICEKQWPNPETGQGSIFEMANATEEEWSELVVGRKGKRKRRLGKRYAKEIVDVIHGRV